MGNYILCRQPLAETPFHIQSVHLNIYSLEELCYFLSRSMALADEVILDDELVIWLERECGFGKTIREYESFEADDDCIGERLMWLFKKSHYFNEQQLRNLRNEISELKTETPARRQKKKGDALLKFSKYKSGIDCYERLLNTDDIEKEDKQLQADVYHNLGVAYEKMFQSGRAVKCFLEAYGCDDTRENLADYLKAVYFDSGRDSFISEARRLNANDALINSLISEIENIKPYDMPEDEEKAIEEWIHAYHVSVDR